MTRLSSSMTLFLALFVPVFWMVFFGSFVFFSWLTADEDLPLRSPDHFRWTVTAIFLVFGFLIYNYLLKLRRVELEEDMIYVTNYFRTTRIPISRITKIDHKNFLGLKYATIQLDFKSSFGQKISCLSDLQRIQMLKEACGLL